MPEKAKLLPVDRRGIAPIVIAMIAVVAVVAVVGVVYFFVLAPPETLADVLAKAAGVTGLQCDIVTTTPEQVVTSKLYWEEGKMRTEATVEGETVVMISREDTGEMYIYYPAQNKAYKMTFTTTDEETPVEKSEAVPTDTAEVIGTEVVDGRLCTVVQYSSAEGTVKAWIWNQYGIPLKIQITTAEGTTTIEYKNVVVGDVSDSWFELPSGVEIIEAGM